MMFDGVLRLELPGWVKIIDFAHGIVLMITSEALEEVDMEEVMVSSCKVVQQFKINESTPGYDG